MMVEQQWLFRKIGHPNRVEFRKGGDAPGWYANWNCGCSAMTPDAKMTDGTQWSPWPCFDHYQLAGPPG